MRSTPRLEYGMSRRLSVSKISPDTQQTLGGPYNSGTHIWSPTCSKDKTIRLCDLSTGQTVQVLSGHTDYVRCLLLLFIISYQTAGSQAAAKTKAFEYGLPINNSTASNTAVVMATAKPVAALIPLSAVILDSSNERIKIKQVALT